MVEQEGLRNGSPPAGPVHGLGRGGDLGAKPPETIGTMKYCDNKNWFLCINCLYVISTEIEKTYSYVTSQAAMATLEMMYPARGV